MCPSNIALAEAQLGIETFKINPESKIELTSQSMKFDSRTGKTQFFNDVIVKYGNLTLSAQTIIFIQSDSEKKPNSLTFTASGSIIISSGENFIYGDEAIFFAEKQELTINGNVSLQQKENTINGDNLVLDLKNGVASISGTVKTVINPIGKKNDI